MKILYLGASGDVGDYVPVEQRSVSLVARELERIYGTRVDLVPKGIWPDAKLPSAVERWMDKEEPDIVYLGIVAWWTTHESVPLKVRRLLGPLGRPVERAGFRMAETPWIQRTALFHWTKQALGRVIGGDPHFQPEEIAANVNAAIKVISRSESTTLVVKGPRHRRKHAFTEKGAAKAEARRLKCNNLVRDYCASHHVEYFGNAREWHPYRSYDGLVGPDRLHTNAAGQKRRVVETLVYLGRACELHGLEPVEKTPAYLASRQFDLERGIGPASSL